VTNLQGYLHDALLRTGAIEPSTNGHTTATLLTLIDWATAFNRPPVDAIIEGLVFPGRWTAEVAPAKLGKSTLQLHIAHCLARGIDPFHGTPRPPIDVLYLDGEMGEGDILERLAALELAPADLPHLHYTDMFPKGDTVQGGAAIVSTAINLCIKVVILDGLNAFITGAEKDDTPWRNLFEQTIAPLKRAGVAIVSSDNTGKDLTLSARGSSAKLDKADAIVMLKRTDDGVNLTTTHQRTSGYLRTLDLAVVGLDGDEPISFRQIQGSWPAGTHDIVALLDSLAVPLDEGRQKVRSTLAAAGHKVRNDVLSAAIRYRKTQAGIL
jgi:RecA-family ATPase